MCLHSHFYQPPRENPWLEAIELQDSARPYHDWNERITAECYAPNAVARILNDRGRIKKIVSNYSRISFNFGPSLLHWMEHNEHGVYQAILAGDVESQKRFSGHGSALAQVYNHIIMPLAHEHDKHIQVRWGIRDFRHRFGRHPEGMWLAETAVDIPTLEVLAEHGISFTILAPHQARRFRRLETKDWQRVSSRGIDPSMAYRAELPSGRSINLFFYDGPISHAVSFGRLLHDGRAFAERLVEGFSDDRNRSQLVHIATDGETYGHHHSRGEMALAYALDYIEEHQRAQITNYGEFLENHPPAYEVEIWENTAWSCAHGIGRWKEDCGCHSGLHPHWHQRWRQPLRKALDWLRDEVNERFLPAGHQIFEDAQAAQDDYISILLDRSEENVADFFRRHAQRALCPSQQVRALKLMEMMRHSLLMYSSDGWFFDDISGIETVQILQYAGRVVQLAQELFTVPIEPEFLLRLQKAESNIPEHDNGAVTYRKFVRPAMVDLPKVGAHYALSSLFTKYEREDTIFCYRVESQSRKEMTAGRVRMVIGWAHLASQITQEALPLSYAVLHLGNHDLQSGVRLHKREEHEELEENLTHAFQRADLLEVSRLLSNHFSHATYSLKTLFRDEQRKILNLIIDDTMADIELNYRRIYERHAPLMHFIKHLDVPQPEPLRTAVEFVLNADLIRALASPPPLDLEHVKRVLDEVKHWDVRLDRSAIDYQLERSMEAMVDRWENEPENVEHILDLSAAVQLGEWLPFPVKLGVAQNLFYDLLHGLYPEAKHKGGESAAQWKEAFLTLGEALNIESGV